MSDEIYCIFPRYQNAHDKFMIWLKDWCIVLFVKWSSAQFFSTHYKVSTTTKD